MNCGRGVSDMEIEESAKITNIDMRSILEIPADAIRGKYGIATEPEQRELIDRFKKEVEHIVNKAFKIGVEYGKLKAGE